MPIFGVHASASAVITTRNPQKTTGMRTCNEPTLTTSQGLPSCTKLQPAWHRGCPHHRAASKQRFTGQPADPEGRLGAIKLGSLAWGFKNQGLADSAHH